MSPTSWRDTDWFTTPAARSVFEAIERVAHDFAERGHALYLVGGVVRDLLLGVAINDLDLTTDARPEVTKSILQPSATALWTQGERFGTIGAEVNGIDVEITTYRAESYDADSRNPVVSFGDDLVVDLSRRDFTINAIAIDANSGELVDPFGGASDLADRVLRTPLDPSVSFTDDPLRMMRAARFVPRFGLRVDGTLTAAVVEHAHRLSIVSAERVHDEFERLLALDDPTLGAQFLVDTTLLGHVAPELPRDRWSEAADVVSTNAASEARSLVRRAAFCVAIGDDAEAWLVGRRYSRSTRRATLAVALAAREMIERVDPLDDVALRRLAADLGVAHARAGLETAAVVGADVATGGSALARLSTLGDEEDLEDFSPPIDGEQIIEAMGIAPGPEVGEAVDRLREHRITHGPITATEALELVRGWAR